MSKTGITEQQLLAHEVEAEAAIAYEYFRKFATIFEQFDEYERTRYRDIENNTLEQFGL